MTRLEAKKKFKKRLDKEYLELFKKGELLVPGKELDWENLNNVFKIKILSYDEEELKVTFRVYEDDAKSKTTDLTFTLDNFFVFNRAHLKKLYMSGKEYDSERDTWENYANYDSECVYIIHNKSSDDESDYYVGQAQHGSWRMKDHLQNAVSGVKGYSISKKKRTEIQEIERIMSQINYTLRFIERKDSGYSNLNALEAAFIAYYNSFHNGYNKTRGNNGPGQNQITKLID